MKLLLNYQSPSLRLWRLLYFVINDVTCHFLMSDANGDVDLLAMIGGSPQSARLCLLCRGIASVCQASFVKTGDIPHPFLLEN